jgi:hypothetical protein
LTLLAEGLIYLAGSSAGVASVISGISRIRPLSGDSAGMSTVLALLLIGSHLTEGQGIVRNREDRFKHLAQRIERDVLRNYCKIYPATYATSETGTYARTIGAAYMYNGSTNIPCALFESRPYKTEGVYDQEVTANEYELHVPRDAPLQANTLIDVKGRRYQVRKMYDQLTLTPTKGARVLEVQFGAEVPTFIVEGINAIPTGLQVTFSVNMSNPTGGVTYLWTFGDGNGDVGASPTHTYGSEGTYQIKVKVTDSTGAFQYAYGEVTVS